MGKKPPDISHEMLEILCDYSWPGNIPSGLIRFDT